MIAALILGTYALAVALFAPALLDRLWPSDRAPRLTVLLLQILSCSFLAAAVGAGLALALMLVEGVSELSPALDRCADALPVGEHSSVASWVGKVGLASAAALSLRILYCLFVTFGKARLRRRAHIRVLRVLAIRDERLGVLVLDHPAPACYCLPGDIVITTGALSRLSATQLEAVLLHERAHVAGRHHLVVALASAVGRTVPHVRLLTYAERETRRLIELIADDAAVARTGAPAVAAALAVIGTGHAPDRDPIIEPPGAVTPDSALGVDSSPTLRRVRRLLRLDRGLTGRARALSLTAAVFVIALPITLLGVSGASLISHCPPDTDDHDAWGPSRSVTVTVGAGADRAVRVQRHTDGHDAWGPNTSATITVDAGVGADRAVRIQRHTDDHDAWRSNTSATITVDADAGAGADRAVRIQRH